VGSARLFFVTIETTTTIRKTLCNRDCPDTCGIIATLENGRVTQLQGDKEHPVTRGFLCHRTNQFLNLQYSPDRILSPLIRRGSGFEPASWTEAMDLIAERLLAIRAESGAASILHYRSAGGMGFVKHATSYFFELFGPVTDKQGDICSGAGEWAQISDFGDYDANDASDLLHAKEILIWGRNIHVSWPHLLPELRAAKAKGTQLTLIDPVHHRTAELCQRHWQPRPGGDFALAMGVARVLFERGWVHPDAGQWCDHLDGFRALAESRSLAEWCGEADLPVDAAEDLAQRLHQGPTTILVGWGMGRKLNGGGSVRALDALGAITGNVGIPGGSVNFEIKRRRPFDLSFVRGNAPRRLTEPLLGQEILAAKDPPIRAVWITAGNPVAMLPDSRTTAHALATRDFVVVVDNFLTDTAEHAHVILPTTTLLEDDDLLGSYGHHYVGVSQPVVERPPNVRSDLEIIQMLAERTGLASELAGDVRTWKRRILAGKLAPAGATLERLEQGPMRNPLATTMVWKDRRFATPNGRAQLMREAPPPAARPTSEFPLLLLSVSSEKSQASQWSRTPEAPLVVTVHPLAACGIADGALGRLESAIGSMTVRVRHDAQQRRDVALVPKGGSLRRGMCANALIRARLSDQGMGAALYDELVRLMPLTG